MTSTTGRHGPHRSDKDPIDAIQARNREWWEATPMSYDWRGEAAGEPDTLAWFEEQDRRSEAAHRHFATDRVPFDRLIPYSELNGRDVLEIGIGAGFHSELIARAGARITGIDLTEAATSRTQRRFQLKGLEGVFKCWDAEETREDFATAFDFVWSWGVIHHSSRTARIVRNIGSWLRPEGRFAGMVYHRHSTSAGLSIARDWVLRGHLFSHSVDEALWAGSDGYSARFYTPDQWRDLLLGSFEEAEVWVTGGLYDVLPLPRALRSKVVAKLSPAFTRKRLALNGSFLIFRAARPLA
jgi:2-polyprenyl-3-methyl-5-hydroxy-6-metoxy-1,4-benzoquinol methylase